MTAQAPGQPAGRWLPSLRALLDGLIEPAPPPPAKPASDTSTATQRLSLTGEIALGLTITVMAVGLYGQTMLANQRMSKRFAFCQPQRTEALAKSEAARQTLSLINNLTSATPSQKVRLAQQANNLVAESARLCSLAALNHSEEAALMTVATAALCLLSLTVVMGLAHGLVNTSNRTVRTLQVTAMFLLVVPMVFLQLGEQVRNSNFYLRLYLAHRNLHQQLLSALANQDLPALSPNPSQANQSPMGAPPALASSGRVAELIRAMDLQVQVLPPVPLDLNDSTVSQVYRMLTKGWQDKLGN